MKSATLVLFVLLGAVSSYAQGPTGAGTHRSLGPRNILHFRKAPKWPRFRRNIRIAGWLAGRFKNGSHSTIQAVSDGLTATARGWMLPGDHSAGVCLISQPSRR